jgi:hypothetical protein
VWFRFDLSGTPPQFRDDVARGDWGAVAETARSDASECEAELERFWVEEHGGAARVGHALVNVAPGWERRKELMARWEIPDPEVLPHLGATDVAFTQVWGESSEAD